MRHVGLQYSCKRALDALWAALKFKCSKTEHHRETKLSINPALVKRPLPSSPRLNPSLSRWHSAQKQFCKQGLSCCRLCQNTARCSRRAQSGRLCDSLGDLIPDRWRDIDLSVVLSIYLSRSVGRNRSVCLSIYLSVYLSISLSVGSGP